MRRIAMLLSVLMLCACAPTVSPSDSAGIPVISGQPALVTTDLPSATLTQLSSTNEISIHDIAMPRVINLWATWCSSCRKEFALLASTEFAGQVVAINVRDLSQSSAGLSTARTLAASTADVFPIYIDKNDTLMTALGVTGLPLTIAVNSEHVIVDVEYGELTHDSLVRLIKASES